MTLLTKTEHMLQILKIIKNVPAMVCEHCNEVYYSDEVFEQIEKIVYKLESVINDIAVIDYTNSAA